LYQRGLTPFHLLAWNQFATDRQQPVANCFGIESLTIYTPQQSVVWVDLKRRRVIRTG